MTMGPSARVLLRQGTAGLHTELDGLFAHVDFDNRHSYGEFLRAQAAPLFALEAAIAESALRDAVPDWTERRRSPAMRRDLDILGVAPPAPTAIGSFTGPDDMLGALYVLEGSRLGAKFIVKQARASRDETVRAATAFLAHGETKPFWPAFLTFLARREAAGLDRDALVAGARGAFAAFLASAKEASKTALTA